MLGWIFGGFVKKLERAANDVSRNFVKASGEEIDRLFDEPCFFLTSIGQRRTQLGVDRYLSPRQAQTEGLVTDHPNNYS